MIRRHYWIPAIPSVKLEAGGRPYRVRLLGAHHAVNALFALVVPIGAAMLWLGVSQNGAEILPYALAFSAGTFICIATSDLLPELQFHRHDRVGLSAALLVGLALAASIARRKSRSPSTANATPGWSVTHCARRCSRTACTWSGAAGNITARAA